MVNFYSINLRHSQPKKSLAGSGLRGESVTFECPVALWVYLLLRLSRQASEDRLKVQTH